ncbi:GNAT family N-acetyltransferase [Alkalihalobacterium bogoriense]|uniref:GNAT family N-acetyltransferase n=1 Tax=Alkalihalobacterium bogoriense TaxID=246272 RepID=UPI00047E1147|nr:GNAT family N-acetyltransferase [Alkalihalobacterium bogoriense]
MIVRLATEQERELIQQYESVVQVEATNGYGDGSISNHTNWDYPCYICINQNIIVGWIVLAKTKAAFTEEITGMIIELYVFPQYRKSGCGTLLMEYALAYFKQCGISKVQLNVFSGNPAKRLYEKLGFQDVSTLMEIKWGE